MTLSIGTHDYVRNGNMRECLYPNVSRLKTHETLQGDSPSSKNTHITECEQFFSPLFYFYYFFLITIYLSIFFFFLIIVSVYLKIMFWIHIPICKYYAVSRVLGYANAKYFFKICINIFCWEILSKVCITKRCSLNCCIKKCNYLKIYFLSLVTNAINPK